MELDELAFRDLITGLENLSQQIADVLIDGQPGFEERRRHELLKAASILLAADGRYSDVSIKKCADTAEALLAEIEKREEAKEQS